MMFRKGPKLGVQIDAAEEKLFRYLYENKVATSEQINRDIYPHYNRRSVNNRLSRLRQFTYLRGALHHGIGSKLVYSLGERGFKEFIKPLGINVKKELGSQAILHDLDLLEIRRMLQQSGHVKNYYPENLISCEGLVSFDVDSFLIDNLCPDAVVQLELKGKPFCLALEYESARKYVDRYKELFARYYGNRSVPGVLYIGKNEWLINYIQNIEKKSLGEETPKFYYSDFSKWNDRQSKVFRNLRGSCITLEV